MKYLLSFLIIVLSAAALASSAEETEAQRAKSEKNETECIDYKEQSLTHTRLAEKMRESLNLHLKTVKPSTSVQHILIGLDKVVLIFNRDAGLAAKPGTLLRNDERARIEKLVATWAAKNKQEQRMIVRFNDECQGPPPAKWK